MFLFAYPVLNFGEATKGNLTAKTGLSVEIEDI